MSHTLSDDDVEAIAQKVVALIAERLASPPRPIAKLPEDRMSDVSEPLRTIAPKLAYTAKELCSELSISRDTLYRLEASGRLRAMPGIRHKRFSRSEVDRLLRGDPADWHKR
jgi:excisionase family DNA binding protein